MGRSYKKGLGFCLTRYHIFQAIAWGSLKKGELSLKHIEQALAIAELPPHTKAGAGNEK